MHIFTSKVAISIIKEGKNSHHTQAIIAICSSSCKVQDKLIEQLDLNVGNCFFYSDFKDCFKLYTQFGWRFQIKCTA